MPSYDFACNECNYRWEVQRKIDEPLPAKCPACWRRTINQVYRRVAVVNRYSPLHPRRNRGRGY